MATDVISSLAGSLDAELEKAKETLRTVDDDIKKVFGKDASELQIFGRGRRPPPSENLGARRRSDRDRDGDEPSEKRWRGGDSFNNGQGGRQFSGGRGRDSFNNGQGQGQEDEYMQAGRRLASRIVSSTKEKSREEVLAEQRQDRTGVQRNRRMFGALLGTLQRFKQDETKLKDREDKRAQIEAKLEEEEKKEREVVKSKKQELIKERKSQLTEIKRLEVKRRRLAELEAWEDKTKYLTNFIRTEAKPHIFYLPKVHNPITECRLEQSKQYVTEMISGKRKLVLEDLEDYEERSKRYWEGRMAGRPAGRRPDPRDADIEEELQEIMRTEEGLLPELGEDDHVEIKEEPVEDFSVTVFNNSTEEGENKGSLEEETETNNIGLKIEVTNEEAVTDTDVVKDEVLHEPYPLGTTEEMEEDDA